MQASDFERRGSMDSIFERTKHTLLAVAYGDAMGMPTENYTRKGIARQFGRVTTFLPSPVDEAAIYRRLAAGEVTDDTQHTVFVCESLLLGHGRVQAKDFVQRLMRWLEHDDKSQYVVGPSTVRALKAIESGVSITEAGTTGTTNGAAMKIAPIGLVHSYLDLEDMVQQVAEICMPTHNTQIAIQGASVIAATVSYCFDHPVIDWDELYELIQQAAAAAEAFGVPRPGPDLMARIHFGWRLAQEENEDRFLDCLYSFMGTGMQTIETVPAVLAIVRKCSGKLKPCVQIAANIGGDTDTIGAICGAICGANHFDLAQVDQQTLIAANDIDFDDLARRMAELIKETRKASHAS